MAKIAMNTRLHSSLDPRLRRLPKHHAPDTGQREYDGQDVGLGQPIGQDTKRSGDAPQAADDTGPDSLGRPPGFQFFHVISPQKCPQGLRADGLVMMSADQASLVDSTPLAASWTGFALAGALR